MSRYFLYWTDIPESRQLATFDSDRLALVVDHGLSSWAPFEVRLNGVVVACWRGAGEVEYTQEKEQGNESRKN